MEIITLTLNPAYDVHYKVDKFRPYSENYASGTENYIGGKGINISMALKTAGVKNMPYVIVGRREKEEFAAFLNNDCILYQTDSDVRKNITVHTEGKSETRISTDDFYISEELFLLLKEDLSKVCKLGTILTFTGRTPKGIDIEEFVGFLEMLSKNGVRIVCDCNRLTMEHINRIKPFLIKPNINEMNELCGTNEKEAADMLYKNGACNVLISLGEHGAFFKNRMLSGYVMPPSVEVVSTVGAGDSTIAGFIYGIYYNLSYEESVKYACSFGTASCMTEYNYPKSRMDIDKIYKNTKIKMI